MRGSTRNVSSFSSCLMTSTEDRRYANLHFNTIDKPDAFAGAPIAMQLVGKHFRDEETVAAADLLAKIVQN